MKNRTLVVFTAIAAVIAGVNSMSFANTDSLSKNTELVTSFYETAFNQRHIDRAISQYMGEEYKQHNPYVSDGPEGFRQGINYYLTEVMPKATFEIVRTISQDDLVMLHVRVSEPAKPDTAIIDIFRVENGRVVEHWDVVQEVPAEQAHGNTMF